MNICVDSFFNDSVSWNGTRPYFSDCFQLSVLIFPCAFFWLILIPYILLIYSHRREHSLPWSWLSRGKFILLTMLSALCLVDCVFEIILLLKGDHDELLKFLSPAILVVTFVLSMIITQLERTVGAVTSSLQFIFSALLLLVGLVPLYSMINNAVEEHGIQEVFPFTAYMIFYVLLLVYFVFNCFSDYRAVPRDINDNPFNIASVLSSMTFWWLNKAVLTAYSKGLEPEDVFRLSKEERVEQNVTAFMAEWEAQKRKRPLREEEAVPAPPDGSVNVDDTEELLERPDGSEEGSDEGSEPEVTFGPAAGSPRGRRARVLLFVSLVRVFGPTLLFSWLFKLFYDVLNFANPLLLRVLLDYTENKAEPAWHGWAYAAAYALLAAVASVCYHRCFFISSALRLRIRSALTSAVYKKALRISNEARGGSTVGEIVNLMSVDTERVSEVVGELWFLWSTVVELTIGIVLLWQELGAATLAGLGVLVLFIPVNGVVMSLLEKYEEKEMESKDERIKALSETLNGMKIIKLYAWEPSYEKRIGQLRDTELSYTRKTAYGWSVVVIVWCIAPYLVLVTSFATYLYTGTDHVLTARRAFVSLTLFSMMQGPMTMFPEGITQLINAYVSIKRLGRFLDADELDDDVSERREKAEGEPAVLIEDGTFSWTSETRPVLESINFAVSQGQLAAVIGSVGCGKSSLVSAILGELLKLDGRVVTRGKIAYVPQQAWIQNMTLQDNILFGLPMDRLWYEKVLDACALRADLEQLSAGDQTEIGERGINLSGGQKQRVSLARAVYCRHDVYLLDDPLSAVDATVGRHIFEQVIGPHGLLRATTRLLVTNSIHCLPETDVVAVVAQGRISELGHYDELMARPGSKFAKFVRSHMEENGGATPGGDSEESEAEASGSVSGSSAESSVPSEMGTPKVTFVGSPSSRPRLRKQSSTEHRRLRPRTLSRQHSELAWQPSEDPKPDRGRLTEDESVAVGKVRWADYLAMLRARGYVLSLVMLFAYLVYTGNSLGASIWLSKWTDDKAFAHYTPGSGKAAELRGKTDYYMAIYGVFGILEMLTVSVFAVFEVITEIRASVRIHQRLLARILRARMSFFDTTPAGRILNRFDRDMEVIDHELLNNINQLIESFMAVISSLIIISITTPIFLAVTVPLGIVYYFIQKFYIPISRQTRRLDSVSRSPIYTFFTESVQGAQVVRAYRQRDRFQAKFDAQVDNNARFTYVQSCAEQWLGFRLEILSMLVVLTTIILAVVGRDTLSAGLVGLSVSYALQITENLNSLIEQLSELETNAVAVERIEEYSKVEPEAPWDGEPPPEGWPSAGVIRFEAYSTRYRPGLDLVLRGLDVGLQPGEKVGIVGRTGAGKSSLTLALFRLIEAAAGRILVDNVPIDQLGLHQLRQRLTILPQEPVLFSGSLRLNLDPLEERDDAELWNALERSHLAGWAQEIEQGLQHDVGEGGANLSVGQRQLVCLARALLRKSPILVLDEATAAVDLDTDRLVMETIREEFESSTVLVIAHRLTTIMEMDRVLVLDQGTIREFGSPAALLQNKEGVFYSLAADAGLVDMAD